MKYTFARKNAFTLVELAIVIIIIGLLVSGVLAGQELVKQAKIHSQIKQFQNYDAAIASFRGKYGFLPGDLPGSIASRFNLTTNASATPIPPNGDGLIGDNNGNVPPLMMWPEPKYFFTQLWEAKLISESLQYVSASNVVGETYPFDKINGKYSGIAPVSLPDSGLYYFMGVTVNNASSMLYTLAGQASLIPEQAFGLDEKLDDGIPSTGKIRAVIVSSNVNTNLTNDTATNSCLGADNTKYNLSSNNVSCRIVVKSGI